VLLDANVPAFSFGWRKRRRCGKPGTRAAGRSFSMRSTAIGMAMWARMRARHQSLGGVDPGCAGCAVFGPSQANRDQLLQLYRQRGLKLCVAADAEEAAIQETRQLLVDNKLKVFKSLPQFLAEYRVYRRGEKGRAGSGAEPLLTCCHALVVSGRQRMCTRPVKMVPVPLPSYSSGARSWMW